MNRSSYMFTLTDVVKNHPTVEAYGFDKLVSSIAIAKIYNDLSEGKITFEAKDIFELGLDEDNGRRFDKIFATMYMEYQGD